MEPALSVLQALLNRRNGRQDDYRIGLIVAGGGMRGCISAGMLACLHDEGLAGLFDCLYGVSAGVPNSCYFLGGQPEGAVSLYRQLANKEHFINYRRSFRGYPLIDGEFLMSCLLEGPSPLPWEKITESKTPLHITTTVFSTGDTKFWRSPSDVENLKLLVEASGQLPTITGHPVIIGEEAYCDGAISCPLPSRQAIADGCTHILCLVNTPKGSAHAKRLEQRLSYLYLQRRVPRLAHLYPLHESYYKQATELLEEMPTAQIIAPQQLLPQLGTHEPAIIAAHQDGYDTMSRALCLV